MGKHEPLRREFFERDTVSVARELLGKLLVRNYPSGTMAGMIVETEAYLGEDDPAAHSYSGMSDRTKILYKEGGLAYVYQSRYHHLLNVSTEKIGLPGCVLIRALEPVDGIATMKKLRGKHNLLDLCSGPAKLCQAMAIDLSFYGTDMTRSSTGLYLAKTETREFAIGTTPRIGISKAIDWPLRFYVVGSRYASR